MSARAPTPGCLGPFRRAERLVRVQDPAGLGLVAFLRVRIVRRAREHLLFDYTEAADRKGLVSHPEMPDPDDPRITHRFRFVDEVPLDRSNLGVLVDFVEYWEIGPRATQHFSWVTDLPLTAGTGPLGTRNTAGYGRL